MEEGKPLVFTLFRAQVFLPTQRPLFAEDAPPTATILRAALEEKPTVQHVGGDWHIGNVEALPALGLYFAIGRQQPKRLGQIDAAGDFQNREALIAPNTHVLLDLRFQVLAIAKNSELAPEPRSVAKKLQKLLQETSVVSRQRATIAIDVLEDPAEFIDAILAAAAVTKFQVSYALPNVFDAERDFQQPFQKTARELGANDSTATFKGDDLARPKLVTLTRAAAAVGKRAKAWVRRSERARPVMVTQAKNPATISAEPVDNSRLVRWADETLSVVRAYYESIRDRE